MSLRTGFGYFDIITPIFFCQYGTGKRFVNCEKPSFFLHPLYEIKKMVYNMLHRKCMFGGMVMACLKCGRETQPGQVFCDMCLEIMEWYPVKPGTAVLLPKRQDFPVRKAVKRRTPSLEDQIKSLHRLVRVLGILLAVMTLFVALMVFPTFQYLKDEHVLPGQNYSTVTQTATQPTTSTGS